MAFSKLSAKAISVRTAHGECWCDRFTMLLLAVVTVAAIVALAVVMSRGLTTGIALVPIGITIQKFFKKLTSL